MVSKSAWNRLEAFGIPLQETHPHGPPLSHAPRNPFFLSVCNWYLWAVSNQQNSSEGMGCLFLEWVMYEIVTPMTLCCIKLPHRQLEWKILLPAWRSKLHAVGGPHDKDVLVASWRWEQCHQQPASKQDFSPTATTDWTLPTITHAWRRPRPLRGTWFGRHLPLSP